MPWLSVYMPRRSEKLIKKFREIATREGRSQSQILVELILCYVKEHEGGNPQRSILPGYEKPVYVVSQFPMERKVQNTDWLLSLIERNPGKKIMFWVARFSLLAGLTQETVREYLKALHQSKLIVYRGSEVYVQGMDHS